MQAAQRVGPVDLLALRVRAAVVGHRHLERPDPEPEQARGQLGVQPEAPLPQVQAPEQIKRHELQAGMQVAQERVKQDVRHRGEHLVAHRVPERLVNRVVAEQAGPVDDIEPAGQDGLDQPRDVLRRVLKVGVERQDVRARRERHRGAERGALPPVPLVLVQDHTGIGELLDQLRGRIVAAVVNHDELYLARVLHRQHLANGAGNGALFIKRAHKDRNFKPRRFVKHIPITIRFRVKSTTGKRWIAWKRHALLTLGNRHPSLLVFRSKTPGLSRPSPISQDEPPTHCHPLHGGASSS